ncbi:MAG: hypothetical protein H9791_07035, partial [Candidatus Bacteroides intestinipullorum]|nr:hypothetical protein [Candidatus Bacteroides intestinipullorum]
RNQENKSVHLVVMYVQLVKVEGPYLFPCSLGGPLVPRAHKDNENGTEKNYWGREYRIFLKGIAFHGV